MLEQKSWESSSPQLALWALPLPRTDPGVLQGSRACPHAAPPAPTAGQSAEMGDALAIAGVCLTANWLLCAWNSAQCFGEFETCKSFQKTSFYPTLFLCHGMGVCDSPAKRSHLNYVEQGINNSSSGAQWDWINGGSGLMWIQARPNDAWCCPCFQEQL